MTSMSRLLWGGILLVAFAATLSCRQQRTVEDALGGQNETVVAAARALQQAWADRLDESLEGTNCIGMTLVLIPPGELLMGAPDSDTGAQAAAKPQHRVRITAPFYLGTHEVTQQQYDQVMGTNPSRFRDDPQRPVENVSWSQAAEFCRRLSELPDELAAGWVYRLPTEAQWEYACRAGSTTAYSHGDSAKTLADHAWHHDNSGGTTHPVGQKRPNAWGLYDMHGNAWEWCADWYSDDYYAWSPTDDPTGPELGEYRVFRGGGWRYVAASCTAAFRSRGNPKLPGDGRGFRVAMVRGQRRSR
jgi:formylglycine-generating enzyme required for sulfatase activity